MMKVADGVFVDPGLMVYRVSGGWRRREIVGTSDDGVLYADDTGPFRTKTLAKNNGVEPQDEPKGKIRWPSEDT